MIADLGMLWFPAGYLLGSIPFSYLAVRLGTGGDLRRIGSGNVGGMNAIRNVNPLLGLLGGGLDVAKGAVTVWLARSYGPGETVALLAAVAAVAGHNWPLFLGFRGGKGIATSAGAMLILNPAVLAIAAAAGALTAVLSRNAYVATVVAFLAAVPAFLYLDASPGRAAFALALTALLTIRLRGDLDRYWRDRHNTDRAEVKK